VSGVEIAERIRAQSTSLTVAERRVAEAILASPQAVGFGTVADLAAAAKVGAASVVRLATKLGFDGYTDLQGSVQRDLMNQLRPAAERIHETSGEGYQSTHTAVEMANVQSTLDAIRGVELKSLTDRLADLTRPVLIVSGEASNGVAQQFADQLHQLRAGVERLGGSDVAVRREIALTPADATAVVIDLRRYEHWVLEAHEMLSERGIWSAALTDSMLSPVAARAQATFVVTAGSVSPFDSHVGTLALLNLVIANVATTLRSSATERLADVEAAWTEHGALTDSI
jgi:DNA-binding MurR/RpiR family transcriptional regulator